jgi:predicted peptidase
MLKCLYRYVVCAATTLAPIYSLPGQAAPVEQPASAASAVASETVAVVLSESSKLPSSPGFFCLDAKVTVGAKQFPMTFGLFLPANYFASKEAFPIVVTLHTEGPKGLGGAGLVREGLASLWVADRWDRRDAEARSNLPKLTLRKNAMFIGIAPQCPTEYDFGDRPMPQIIAELVTQVGKAYRTDPERAYLTGFSYGGTSCWLVAEQVPGRFAAIAPISSRNTPDPEQTAQRLKDLPIYLACGVHEWAFSTCEMMKAALAETHHPNYVYRVVPDGTHWCYPTVYNDPEFWTWLFSKRRNAAQQ